MPGPPGLNRSRSFSSSINTSGNTAGSETDEDASSLSEGGNVDNSSSSSSSSSRSSPEKESSSSPGYRSEDRRKLEGGKPEITKLEVHSLTSKSTANESDYISQKRELNLNVSSVEPKSVSSSPDDKSDYNSQKSNDKKSAKSSSSSSNSSSGNESDYNSQNKPSNKKSTTNSSSSTDDSDSSTSKTSNSDSSDSNTAYRSQKKAQDQNSTSTNTSTSEAPSINEFVLIKYIPTNETRLKQLRDKTIVHSIHTDPSSTESSVSSSSPYYTSREGSVTYFRFDDSLSSEESSAIDTISEAEIVQLEKRHPIQVSISSFSNVQTFSSTNAITSTTKFDEIIEDVTISSSTSQIRESTVSSSSSTSYTSSSDISESSESSSSSKAVVDISEKSLSLEKEYVDEVFESKPKTPESLKSVSITPESLISVEKVQELKKISIAISFCS